MKRDMDLIRKILFYIEDNYQAGGSPIDICEDCIDGYSSGEIYEHCQLAYQSGLIQKPLDASTTTGRFCLVSSLTNSGYDYLDKIREDTIWNNTKKVIKEKGLPMLIETIRAISTALVSAATESAVTYVLKTGGK